MAGSTVNHVVQTIKLPQSYSEQMQLWYKVKRYFALNLCKYHLKDHQFLAIILLEAYAYECGKRVCFKRLASNIAFGGLSATLQPEAQRVVAELSEVWRLSPHETVSRAVERFVDKYDKPQRLAA